MVDVFLNLSIENHSGEFLVLAPLFPVAVCMSVVGGWRGQLGHLAGRKVSAHR